MSRDPSRIKPIIEQLEKLWAKHPDMRFAEIIKKYAVLPTQMASKEDEDVYLSLCNENHCPPAEFSTFIKD